MCGNHGTKIPAKYRKFNQKAQLAWGPSNSPNALSTYQKELQNIASQQQLLLCQRRLEESESNLRAEQARLHTLNNEKIHIERCLQETNCELQQQNRQLDDVKRQLHSTSTLLTHTEKRGQERWAAVISLTELLHCQTSEDGEQVDIAKLSLEKEALRDEGIQLKLSLAGMESHVQQVNLELQQAREQLASDKTRWERSLLMQEQRTAEMKTALGNCNNNCSRLDEYIMHMREALNQKNQEFDSFRKQAEAWRGRPLVGPVPENRRKNKQ